MPLALDQNFVSYKKIAAAKAILCACCAQHSTCSKMCDKSIAVNENCAPNVGPDEKLPRIKEQWFKATKNGSYEMR